MLNKDMRSGDKKDLFASKNWDKQSSYQARKYSQCINEEENVIRAHNFRRYSDNRNFAPKQDTSHQHFNGRLSFQRTGSFQAPSEINRLNVGCEDSSPVIDTADRPFLKLNLGIYQNSYFFPKGKAGCPGRVIGKVASSNEMKINFNNILDEESQLDNKFVDTNRSPEESKQSSHRNSSNNLIFLNKEQSSHSTTTRDSFCLDTDNYFSNGSNYNKTLPLQKNVTSMSALNAVNPFNCKVPFQSMPMTMPTLSFSNSNPNLTPGLFSQNQNYSSQYKFNNYTSNSTISTCSSFKDFDNFNTYNSNKEASKVPNFRKSSSSKSGTMSASMSGSASAISNVSTVSSLSNSSFKHNYNKNKSYLYKNNYNKYNNNINNENTKILSVKIQCPTSGNSNNTNTTISNTNIMDFNVHRFDDLLTASKNFCERNKLSEKLVKPVLMTVSESLGHIFKVYNAKVDKNDEEYLNSLNIMYKNKQEERNKDIEDNSSLEVDITSISSITLGEDDECDLDNLIMLNKSF